MLRNFNEMRPHTIVGEKVTCCQGLKCVNGKKDSGRDQVTYRGDLFVFSDHFYYLSFLQQIQQRDYIFIRFSLN